jgi:hypothetical protein
MMKTERCTGYFLGLLLLISYGFTDSEKSAGNDPVRLGNKREIFVDHYLIDKLENARIVLHHPHDEGIVMYFDKPWEGLFCSYCTVIKDGDLFRLYYRGWEQIKGSQVTCYAESKDGISWIKPELGICESNGSKSNNILLDTEPETHNFSPFLDTNPGARPDQRFKALGGSSKKGLIPYASSDGIHWKRLKDDGVIKKGAFDSQNVSFWSGSEGLYISYFRIFTDKRVRGVSRSVSKDFINWSEPVEMTYGDTPPEHLYTQQTSPYFRAPHIYLAIGARFFPDRQILSEEQLTKLKVDPTQHKGLSEPYLMSTRGGNVYNRTFMEAFIRPGIGPNNWSARTNYPVLNVVQTSPEEMSVYLNQDYAQPTAHLHRYSLRLDGFTSINAPYSGGNVISKPFIFLGKELEMNYSTSAAGEIRVEIQDTTGNPIQGYTMEESQTIIGNEITGTVSWNGNTNLSSLASKPVRLKIYMKDADLYSLRFK